MLNISAIRIIPKLIAEENANLGSHSSGSAKKGTLDVHRGGTCPRSSSTFMTCNEFLALSDTYQFGYFLRNTEPHAVLIKTRRFFAAPPKPKAEPPQRNTTPPPPEPGPSRKRGGKGKGKAPARKKRTKKAAATVSDSEEEEVIELSGDEDEDNGDASWNNGSNLRRSARKRTVISSYVDNEDGAPQEGGDGDTPMLGRSTPSPPPPSQIRRRRLSTPEEEVKEEDSEPALADSANKGADPDVEMLHSAPVAAQPDTFPPLADLDEPEEKPKLVMSLRYQGFSIHGRCLCVIVEPYPPIRRNQQRQMSLNPTGIVAPRAPSIAPPDFVPSGSGSATQRAKTPLFLPDYDDDSGRRSVTPAPVSRVRPPVPLFNDEPEQEDDDNGGMFAFSQILQSVGEHHTGAVDDDDEMEGMVLFGDADEAREL